MGFAGKDEILVAAPQPVDLVVHPVGLLAAGEEADLESVRMRPEPEALIGVGVAVTAQLHDARDADLALEPLQPPGLLLGRHDMLGGRGFPG